MSLYTAVIYGLKLSGRVEDRALNSAEESPASESPERKSMLTRFLYIPYDIRRDKVELSAQLLTILHKGLVNGNWI